MVRSTSRKAPRAGRVALIPCVALVTLMLAADASAHRSPTRAESAAISAALHKPNVGIRRGLCFHVRSIVVSTAGPWASAKLVPCSGRGDRALAVLQRVRGKWRVRDVGTSGVGCTVAPARVRRDLHLVCDPSFTAGRT
jgi:hypothetical protein